MARKIVAAIILGALLGGCGATTDLFGGVKELDRSRPPDNATEYRCNETQHFYVRYIDGDAAAWVILPERQFRLDRKSAGEYSNRTTRLEIKQGEASLTDDSDLKFVGCKVPEKS